MDVSTRRFDTARGLVTFLVVAGCAGFVFAQLQPTLLFSDTTPAGGDMGAHVWAPAYLRDHLIPSGRLTGWTPDWYAGFPAMHFYMLGPMLAIVGLSLVLPYGIAFKLVTVSGIVLLPVAAYLFGRLVRMPFPVPAFLAVGATVFVFDRSFSIYGGNAASTLAGEFAFSISLALALVYVGLVGRGLADGRHRALAAGLLALTGLCHLIPAFFAIVATGLWYVLWVGHDSIEAMGSLAPDRWRLMRAATWARTRWILTMAPVAGLLAAFWVLPFYGRSRYLNDMGWEKEPRWVDFLFWREGIGGGGLVDYPQLAFLVALAIVSAVVVLALRSRGGVFLLSIVLTAGVAFVYVPQGRLWNTRVLPFYYLGLCLLTAVGLALFPRVLQRVRLRRRLGVGAAGVVVVVQYALITQPASLDPIFDTLRFDSRWDPYFVVALLVVTAVAGSEMVDATTRVRRIAAWSLVGIAVLLQALMWQSPSLRAGDRFLGYALAVLFLIGLAAVLEVVDGLRSESGERPGWVAPAAGLAGTAFVIIGVWMYLAVPLRSLGPLGSTDASTGEYGLTVPGVGLVVDMASTTDDSFVDSWAAWNYAGYESACDPEQDDPCTRGEKQYYPEYHAIVTTMAEVGETNGCGRAMWEYDSELDRYGTPMALMLLPHWTDGCIGSMEGLYFEASTTTPYHFLNQDELSESGSNAQRGLPYGAGAPTQADFDRGIDHLQMLGVRYYMAYSDLMKGYAEQQPDLTEVARSPAQCLEALCPDDVQPVDRWIVYEVADSDLVEALDHEPVVLSGVGAGHTCETVDLEEDPRGRVCEGWLDPAVEFYVDEAQWDVLLAESGPSEWGRVPVDDWLENHDAPRTEVDPAVVSDVEIDRDRISFSVDEPGKPVLVKSSYFPNWKTTGADGPYRVTPNLMVVVPTGTEVELYYGWTPLDIAGWALTLLGLVGLVWLARRPPVLIPPGPVAEWHRTATVPAVAPPGEPRDDGAPENEPAPVPESAPVPEPPSVGPSEGPGVDVAGDDPGSRS